MKARRELALLAGVVAFAGAAWACQALMEPQALAAVMDAHEQRWTCLSRETLASPGCARDANLGFDDADWCKPAVTACHAEGWDAAVEAAQASWLRWMGARRVLVWSSLLAALTLV